MKRHSWIVVFMVGVILLVLSCSKNELPYDNDGKNPIQVLPSITGYEIPFDYKGGKRDTRSHLTCNSYSSYQIDSLERVHALMMERIHTVRGRVVASAIFLASMPYCIPYAWEQGQNPGVEYVGRYMRKGPFLRGFTENGRYYDKSWGCQVEKKYNAGQGVLNIGNSYPNGLICSATVGWCLLNGGAATVENVLWRYNDGYDYYRGAEKVSLQEGAGDILPGDLLWFEGHIAIVVGVDGNTVIYVSAEGGTNATWQGAGVRWLTFDRVKDLDNIQYTHFFKMEGVYNKSEQRKDTKINSSNWVVNASSHEMMNEQRPPQYLIDGDYKTFWHSLYSGVPSSQVPNFPHWITIDMLQESHVTQIGLVARNNADFGGFTRFDLHGSLDGEQWVLLEEGLVMDPIDKALQIYEVERQSVRYIKITMRSPRVLTYKLTYLAEIELYTGE